MIFNKIILNKFGQEYTKEISFVGDNNCQNKVFNSIDLMCYILKYLTYNMKFNGELFNCELVNSKWLYHVWNPNLLNDFNLTQLFCVTTTYNSQCKNKNIDVGVKWILIILCGNGND